ncbi:RNA polymerase sigma factor [Oceanobacillus sojae]|uniref:RNA polymerase sigma factor n=1 Tax=Oceanobacillus sojae TaxID=582851 RepID=UPI0021A8D8DB|nr:RNA polymerase sigma factor [Oceanobacillus sojae]MCT1903186.1 RNA polymerase sigma factor [Oceanobacillus sojae]
MNTHYKAQIYQFIFRYCQEEQLCLDLIQDTFVKFLKYQANFDEGKSSIKTYLFRIAYQLMINRLKKRNRMRKILPFLYVLNQLQSLSYEDKITVQTVIQQLPKERRAVILLTYYHDLTQKDISEVLEIPIGTVKSRLHASLKKLKVLLEGKE